MYLIFMVTYVTVNSKITLKMWSEKSTYPEKDNYFTNFIYPFSIAYSSIRVSDWFSECLLNVDLIFKVILRRALEIN